MSDTKKTTLQQPPQPISVSRRKLTSAALAGPVILGALASKQALGGTIPYQCTISGQISDTASARPGENINCSDLGRSPGFWKNRTGCWGAVNPQAAFNAVFTGSTKTDTLSQVLHENGTLERAAVASFLNAVHFHTNEPAYPLSSDQVVSLYTQYSGGGDIYPGMSLKQYFETLYRGHNESWPGGNQPCQNDNHGGGGD
jgi:hypothetical protein